MIETTRNNGYGDTLEEKGQEALDNYFDMRQAEAVQDCINLEEMVSLSLRNSTKTALDEKLLGYWQIRTSALSESSLTGSPELSAAKRAIQAIVSRRREAARDDRPDQRQCCDNFHTLSADEESESETDLESLNAHDLRYATDDKDEFEAMIGQREARKNCSKRQHR